MQKPDFPPFAVGEMTPQGLELARDDILGRLREGRNLDAVRPMLDTLLSHPAYSEPVAPPVYVERRPFANRREAGAYLQPRLEPLGARRITGNYALWSWLGMFYLEQTAGRYSSSGRLRVSASDVAYILDPQGGGRGVSQGHRHRLMAAYEIYARHGERAWCMLDQPLSSMEHFAERLLGAPLLFNAPGIVELAHLLYADRRAGAYKQHFQGSGSEQRPPGGMVRLIDVLNQLSMTYDVYGMAAGQLLPLLPPEFDEWKPAAQTA